MIKHVWSIVCSKSSIDKETNNVSLFEVLEQLSLTIGGVDAEKIKAESSKNHIVAPLNFEIVSLWDKERTSGKPLAEMKAAIVDPNGRTLGAFSHEFQFEEGKRRMRVNLKVSGLPVSCSGIYKIPVMFKEKDAKDYKIVAELPLEVTVNFS